MQFTLIIAALVSLAAAAPATEPVQERGICIGGYNPGDYFCLNDDGVSYLVQCGLNGQTSPIAKCNCQTINGSPYCV
ncbi:hypothetical protein GQ53DRAFT_849413 [Thozetella sp. PMI_491]|nr:hypothetical protein GQ53DRAFT_849413 [Thozetella sp. PMI_491]